MTRPPLAAVVAAGALAAGLFGATVVGELAAAAPAPGASAAPLPAQPLRDRGRLLVQAKGCIACHVLPDVGGQAAVGPSLVNLRLIAGARRPGLGAAAYVRESIARPGAFIVPGFPTAEMPQLGLSDAEIEAVVAFLLPG